MSDLLEDSVLTGSSSCKSLPSLTEHLSSLTWVLLAGTKGNTTCDHFCPGLSCTERHCKPEVSNIQGSSSARRMTLLSVKITERMNCISIKVAFLNKFQGLWIRISLKDIEVYEYKGFVIFLIDPVIACEGICIGEPRQINSGLMSEFLVFMFIVYCRKTLK